MRIAWDESPSAASERFSHAERVAVAIDGIDSDPKTAEVLDSWRRSAGEHRVDPDALQGPGFADDQELRHAREPLEQLLQIAQVELDQLHEVVRRAGYLVLFSDPFGMVVEDRQDDVGSMKMRPFGSFLGSMWAESLEGTNGIGTCLAERRAVTVHRSQHFRSSHKTLSCSAVPVHDPDGQLVAVLDISAPNPDQSEHAHALTLPLLEASVAALEERLFRDRYSNVWIVALPSHGSQRPMHLLAVDRDQCIVGADPHARFELGLSALGNDPALSSLFLYDRAPFRRQDGMDSVVHFQPRDGSEVRPSIVTAPSAFPGARLGAVDGALRLRSRRSLISEVQRLAATAPMHGALTAGALRRVSAHIESRLSENITLEALAQEAKLSVYHFARAFKLAVGMPPHRYVMEQRVLRAKGLLQCTDQSVAEIALAVGFADQSHLARHFGRSMGLTPTAYRRGLR